MVIKKILQFDSENVNNVAEKLVTNVIFRCNMAGVRSDNTSAIVIFFEEKSSSGDCRDNPGVEHVRLFTLSRLSREAEVVFLGPQ